MSWRFRKSFKVIPGVRLNLTRNGLSATLGAAPFSVNVGPKGTYANMSIPGTGIWDRERLDAPSRPSGIQPSSTDQPYLPALLRVPAPVPISPSPTEIRSASTELLTSESLEHLRKLLTDAFNERDELTKEVSTATHEENTATRRYQNWERGFLLKQLFKKSFTTRKETAETAVAKLAELQEQLRLTTIATEINVDREQAEPYYRMRDAFAALSECQKIWNVLTEKAVDRVAERSSSDTAVTRTAVPFSLSACDLIQWDQKVPNLANRTGGDMFVYPGFILYRASKQAFALIDSRDVTLRYVSTQFTENETVPSDSQIIGQTWAKCNKDGSPDRRFRDNYQIPVAHYGTLMFSTNDGLDVRYICSNATSTEGFVKAWMAFRMSFNGPQQKAETSAPQQPNDTINTIERNRKAYERTMAATTKFQAATEAFTSVLQSTAHDKQQGGSTATITTDDLEAYQTAVTELSNAAKDLEANAVFVPSSAKGKYHRAIEMLDATWKNFVSGKEGQINGDGLVPFLNYSAEFLKMQGEFYQAITAAIKRTTKKLGAPIQ